MYIHIGQDISLLSQWIVMVLDMDKATAQSSELRDFLLRAEQANRLQWLGPEIPRSIIITIDRVYLSPVTCETLKARFSLGYFEDHLEDLNAVNLGPKGRTRQ